MLRSSADSLVPTISYYACFTLAVTVTGTILAYFIRLCSRLLMNAIYFGQQTNFKYRKIELNDI